jgi:hypothetical protein
VKGEVGVICLIFDILAVAVVFAFFWLWRYYHQKVLAGKAKGEAAMAVDYTREHPNQAFAAAGVAAERASGA